MLQASAVATNDALLSEEEIRNTLNEGLAGRFSGARVLALIPDRTRTLPLPLLFPMLVECLSDARQLDFMVALGTHPPLSHKELCALVGLTPGEYQERFSHVSLLNHEWDNPSALTELGVISDDQLRELCGPAWHHSLGGDVPVNLNRAVLDYDHVLIVGPCFPHEVVGISGGAKYLFPGISGPELINRFHWLGALITTMKIIGKKDTPVRDIIHQAAELVPTPLSLLALVVVGEGLAGMFIGDHLRAWDAAARLSQAKHIRLLDHPYPRVLSWCPPMYDELWTGAKAMYKLEPAVADGGELVIYAPHLDTVSVSHGRYIYEVGYHVLPWFLRDWSRYSHYPTSVIAHSTHVKGIGAVNDGVEEPRIKVTLSSRIPREDCETLNLGYRDPATLDLQAWREREDALFVPKAGEILYRVKDDARAGAG